MSQDEFKLLGESGSGHRDQERILGMQDVFIGLISKKIKDVIKTYVGKGSPISFLPVSKEDESMPSYRIGNIALTKQNMGINTGYLIEFSQGGEVVVKLHASAEKAGALFQELADAYEYFHTRRMYIEATPELSKFKSFLEA